MSHCWKEWADHKSCLLDAIANVKVSVEEANLAVVIIVPRSTSDSMSVLA